MPSNEAIIWSYLIGVGLPAAAAAGVMGNFQTESGFNPDSLQPSTTAPAGYNIVDGEHGFGIAQWTDAGRQQGLVDYASAQGAATNPPNDLQIQLGYFWQELNDNYHDVLDAIKEATTPAEAAVAFYPYEGYAGGIQDARSEQATQIYNQYSGSTLVDIDSTGGTASLDSTGDASWQAAYEAALTSVPAADVPDLAVIPTVNKNAVYSPQLIPGDWKFFYNKKGTQIIDDVTTASNVDLTEGSIPQISLTINDPDFSIMQSIAPSIYWEQGKVGQLCTWKTESLVLSEVQTTQDDNGVPATIVTLGGAVFSWMQVQRQYRSFEGTSAKIIQDLIALYNKNRPKDIPAATFRGQTGPTPGVSEPAIVVTDRGFEQQLFMNGTLPQVSWQSYFDYMVQLQQQEGFWLFETNGGVFFGEPPWIYAHTVVVKVGWRGLPGADYGYTISSMDCECIEPPVILRSQILFTGDQMTLQLPRGVGEQMRVGHGVKIYGIGSYFGNKQWLVQEVTFALDGGETPVQVICNEATYIRPPNPGGQTLPNPNADPTDPGANSAGGSATAPTDLPASAATASASVTSFMKAAFSQTGDPYQYGGTDTGDTPTDCSGLVMWCSQQVGSSLGSQRTAADQYNYIKSQGLAISAQQAYSTYGALLFAGDLGHVVISMGDNVHVFSEQQTGTNAGETSWPYPNSALTLGGLVPGLTYQQGE
jgi:cell wall-associated NlpC family hydrolase